ncbi:MAG: type II toxin-antitoxin system PemK/MazF family toxin [Anaerolineales bacterium]|nr:type II toxin-antitoxin system PemK/MazF family toxin [Anaerolineales bacterium]
MKGYPFEVQIPQGQQVSGVILADQVKSLDWRARRAEKMDGLPEAVVVELLQKLLLLLPMTIDTSGMEGE